MTALSEPERLRAMVAMRAGGLGYQAIGTTIGLSPSQVQRILAASGSDSPPPKRPIPDVVTVHLDWMRRRRMSEETLKTRFGHLMRLERWAAARGRTLLDLDCAALSDWQAEFVDRAAVSERSAVSSAREFYRWAVNIEELISADPTRKLILPRVLRGTPRPIREERLELAFERADPAIRAVLALAAMAGLRCVEIARLSWDDLDIRGLMHVTGKGGHQRSVDISASPGLIEALSALPRRRGPVIPRLDGKPGHNLANTLDRRVNQYLHDLGIEETLHQLRHRFATVTYQATQDPIAVQRLLGHSSLTTTSIYAGASSENSRAAMAAASLGKGPVGRPRLAVVPRYGA